MTINISSPFRSSPRISREGFLAVLERTGSFDAEPLWGPFTRKARPDVAYQCYDIIAEAGHDPAVHLAIMGKEHTFGTNQDSVLWRNNTRSYSNARTIRHPDVLGEIITDSYRRSNYVRYQDVRDSFRDGVYRVDDPAFAYRQANANTIAEVIAIWAPGNDGNRPLEYARTMVEWINEWAEEFKPESEDSPVSKPKIALAAGHRNSDGGNAVERALVAEHTWHAAQTLRRAGADVRVVTPDDGRGTFPGGLQAVGQRVVDWHNGGWQADLFIEFHTQGYGPANQQPYSDNGRGVFVIYPDTGNDVDVDVRDRYGTVIASEIASAMGIPTYRNGLMSEGETGIGRQGFRLGVFLRTEPIRRTCTRMLIESGAHSSPSDLEVLQRPETPGHIAEGLTSALAQFYDLETDDARKPSDDPNARYFAETDHWIVNTETEDGRITMLDHWRDGRGITGNGYPISGMRKDDDGVYRQLCENVLLEAWPPGTWGDNEEIVYRYGGLGQRYRRLELELAACQVEVDEIVDCECA